MASIIEFVTKGALIGGVRNYVWLGLLAFLAMLCASFIIIVDNRDKRMIETARETGAATTIIESQNAGFEQIERVKDADRKIDAGDLRERYERCLRNNEPATRANCQRFSAVPGH